MSRRHREAGFFGDVFEILLGVPIWVGPVLAVAAFLGFRYAWPALLPNRAPLASIGPAIAPVVGLVFIAAWIGAEFQKRQRRALLDAQTDLSGIRNLSWKEFEHLVGEAYRRRGFHVRETGSAGGDGGVDLVLSGMGKKVLVQCKQWRTRRVGVQPVRELFGVMTAENADKAILVTSGSFTREAQRFAADKPLELLAGPALHELVKSVRRDESAITPNTGPSPKRAVETSVPRCPRCNLEMVLRVARRGLNAGRRFWGCPGYPQCRGTREWDAD